MTKEEMKQLRALLIIFLGEILSGEGSTIELYTKQMITWVNNKIKFKEYEEKANESTKNSA